jgi:branched-chain amino acid transport system permease protein
MPDGADIPAAPGAADEARIGVDEWVAQVEARREAYTGISGYVRLAWDRLPPAGRLVLFVVPAAVAPLLMGPGNLFRYGLFTLVYVLLAYGLNVVVGFAGLLDLGYIAFFGWGAYTYGIFASPHFNNHWQAEIAVPIAVGASALAGLVVGLPSRRLIGDYLAIVTLFFGQAFVVFVNNANRINFPFLPHVDLTGGSNGIDQIDPLNLFGFKIASTREFYYFLLIAVAIVVMLLHFVNESRTGRAWRSLREDPLAAEVMSIPVNRLKLLAFVFGAAIAGFTGAIYGSIATAALPGDYTVGLLITIYAILILGGLGSLSGIALGALIINAVPELLRSPTNARWIFYGTILVTLLLKLRPWRKLGAVLALLVGFGFAVHAIASAAYPRLTEGHAQGGGAFARAMQHWMLYPRNPEHIADVCYILLIAAILLVQELPGLWRAVVLVPVLYLASFVWENRLFQEIDGATRLILLGALLIAVMHARPQGLFGKAYVEIV